MPTVTRRILRAGTVLSLVGLFAVSCTDGERTTSDAGVAAAPPLAVTTAPAVIAGIGERLEAGGLVAARESAVVSSRVLSPVTEVRPRAGDRVRAGDILVVLDDRDVGAQVRQANAAVAAAEQALAAARADQQSAEAEQTLAAASHARIASLHQRNSATAQELDEATARLSAATARSAGAAARIQQATAQLEAARAATEAAETVRSFTTLRAPFDGIITERLIDPGNLASPGMPLLRLDGSGARTVHAQVDTARVPYVSVGDRVEVLFDAAPGAEAGAVEGVVSEVSRAVSADTRTFTVEVALPASVSVRSGTFARVRFQGAAREALVVPASAVRRQGQLASVFVADADVARLRLVQTGRETERQVEVLAGLAAGEIVVTNPPAGLTDGRRITPRAAAPGETESAP